MAPADWCDRSEKNVRCHERLIQRWERWETRAKADQVVRRTGAAEVVALDQLKHGNGTVRPESHHHNDGVACPGLLLPVPGWAPVTGPWAGPFRQRGPPISLGAPRRFAHAARASAAAGCGGVGGGGPSRLLIIQSISSNRSISRLRVNIRPTPIGPGFWLKVALDRASKAV